MRQPESASSASCFADVLTVEALSGVTDYVLISLTVDANSAMDAENPFTEPAAEALLFSRLSTPSYMVSLFPNFFCI
jgi:hypothetical protein